MYYFVLAELLIFVNKKSPTSSFNILNYIPFSLCNTSI